MSSLIMAPYGNGFLITGNTMAYKDQLKQAGASWNATLKGWMFQGSKKATAEELVKNSGGQIISENAKPPTSEPRPKTVSHADFLSLVSRIEKLEQEVARLGGNLKPNVESKEREISFEDAEEEIVSFKGKKSSSYKTG